MCAWRDAGLKACRKQEKLYSPSWGAGLFRVTALVNLSRENSSMSHASFPSLPFFCGRARGHSPGRLRTARLHTLGSPTARLVLRSLAVVARRAQRTQTRGRVRNRDATCGQHAARLREVVSNRPCLAAQHAPRMRVQVAAPEAFSLDPVTLGRDRPALLLRFLGVLRAASARGQFRAAGYRTRGVRGMGVGACRAWGITSEVRGACQRDEKGTPAGPPASPSGSTSDRGCLSSSGMTAG